MITLYGFGRVFPPDCKRDVPFRRALSDGDDVDPRCGKRRLTDCNLRVRLGGSRQRIVVVLLADGFLREQILIAPLACLSDCTPPRSAGAISQCANLLTSRVVATDGLRRCSGGKYPLWQVGGSFRAARRSS